MNCPYCNEKLSGTLSYDENNHPVTDLSNVMSHLLTCNVANERGHDNE